MVNSSFEKFIANSLKSLAIVSLAVSVSACISAAETTPPIFIPGDCDEEGCEPGTTEFSETIDPVVDDGSLYFVELIDLFEEFSDNADEALARLQTSVDEHDCGPACDKEITSSATISVEISSNVTDDPACDVTFEQTLTSSQTSRVSCDAAGLEVGKSMMGKLPSLDQVCKDHNPICGAKRISLGDGGVDIQYTKIPSGYIFIPDSCQADASATVTVECGKGSGASLLNASFSGEFNATVACTEGESDKCETCEEKEEREAKDGSKTGDEEEICVDEYKPVSF